MTVGRLLTLPASCCEPLSVHCRVQRAVSLCMLFKNFYLDILPCEDSGSVIPPTPTSRSPLGASCFLSLILIRGEPDMPDGTFPKSVLSDYFIREGAQRKRSERKMPFKKSLKAIG